MICTPILRSGEKTLGRPRSRKVMYLELVCSSKEKGYF